MKRTSKLALLDIIILFGVVYIWTFNSMLALVLFSIMMVPFMKNVFEIKKYHNRNLYLAFSAVFSIAWLISTGIWVLSQDQALNNVLAIAAGLLILSTFYSAFSNTREWDKFWIH
ncbi:MAG TPA: hypothetical protein VHO92_07535 [Methanobacterium sp.]|nr:hypothetical protein [Methanobacterium sp.]